VADVVRAEGTDCVRGSNDPGSRQEGGELTPLRRNVSAGGMAIGVP
jgi:hypothetical protein